MADAEQPLNAGGVGSEDVFWVHDLGWDGRGVARRSDGRIIFIWGALPGDSVRAEITAEPKKGPLSGELKEVLDPSPQRVPHPCPHYYQGCPASLLGAVRREFSLNWKRDHLVETFRRIGGLSGVVVEDVIPSPRQWRYRERLEFSIQREGERLVMGYQARDGLLGITDCRLGSETLVDPYARLREKITRLEVQNDLGSRFPLRLLLRDNGQEGAVAVLFVIGKGDVETTEMEAWLADAHLTGWQIRQASNVKNRYFASTLLAEQGDPRIYHHIAGDTIAADPTAFSQANPRAAHVLVRLALEHVPVKANLLDLYGGFGAFALEHAARGGRGTVVESSRASLEAGAEFAERLQLDVEFVEADLGKGNALDNDLSAFDAVLMDPPRSGADEILLKHLDQHGPERMVYVSCHPAALARDLRRLQRYATALVIPVDMFPSTSDLETIAILDRIEK